jgi:hypothetical protein
MLQANVIPLMGKISQINIFYPAKMPKSTGIAGLQGGIKVNAGRCVYGKKKRD